jgi:hypothetical protein
LRKNFPDWSRHARGIDVDNPGFHGILGLDAATQDPVIINCGNVDNFSLQVNDNSQMSIPERKKIRIDFM